MEPAHGSNILDMLFTNRTDTVSQGHKYSLKTDHMARFVNLQHASVLQPSNRQVGFYDVCYQHILQVTNDLQSYDWSHVLNEDNIDAAHQALQDIAKWHIDTHIHIEILLHQVLHYISQHWSKHYYERKIGSCAEGNFLRPTC